MKDFKAGEYVDQETYLSFQPFFINKPWEVQNMEVINLLSQADQQLGRLDMYSHYVNVDLFIRMLIAKEAVLSFKSADNSICIEDVFLVEKLVKFEKQKKWKKVQNYIFTINKTVEMLDRLPFSTRLIRESHKLLFQKNLEEHKLPGDFRSIQNWVGGASLKDAVFVPPVHSSIPGLITDLEKFANNRLLPVPDLMKAAIIHYQFETIHPFSNGNGRIGSLLITLYLISSGVLKKPILFLSDFFERHRTLYHDNLMRVRTHNDMDQWIKFFLVGTIESAGKGIRTLESIMQLQKEVDRLISDMGVRKQSASMVLEHLYKQPLIDARKVSKITNKSMVPSYKLIAELEKRNILREITGNERDRIYVFENYLNIFKD